MNKNLNQIVYVLGAALVICLLAIVYLLGKTNRQTISDTVGQATAEIATVVNNSDSLNTPSVPMSTPAVTTADTAQQVAAVTTAPDYNVAISDVISDINTVLNGMTPDGRADFVWHPTSSLYDKTVSFDTSSDVSGDKWKKTYTSSSALDAAKRQVVEILTSYGLSIDSSREYIDTSCGAGGTGTFYTDGTWEVLIYSFDDEYTDIDPELQIHYALVADLEFVEKEDFLPASVIFYNPALNPDAIKRYTIAGLGKNALSAEEKYLIYYNPHCTDIPFYYYEVDESGTPNILVKGAASYATDEDCAEWQASRRLNETDKTFLYETFCSPEARAHRY